MDTFDLIQSELSDLNPSALYADGFDAALLGYVTRCGFLCSDSDLSTTSNHLALYDYQKCIAILMDRDFMSYEDAIDYMEFNVIGAWMGTGTPCFLHRPW